MVEYTLVVIVITVHVVLVLQFVDQIYTFAGCFFVIITLENTRVLFVLPHPSHVLLCVCFIQANEVEESAVSSVQAPDV